MKQNYNLLFELIAEFSNNKEYSVIKNEHNKYHITVKDTNKVVWKIGYKPDKQNEEEIGYSGDAYFFADLNNVLKVEFHRIFICENLGIENSYSFVLEIPSDMNQIIMFHIILTTIHSTFDEAFNGLLDREILEKLREIMEMDNSPILYDDEDRLIYSYPKIKKEYLKSYKTQDVNEFLNDDVGNEQNKSALDFHMQSFDNLGFKNEKVFNWHRQILNALENDNYVMSDFYYTKHNTNNKTLLQHIALKSDTFNFLNNIGLLNTGYCPITGEKIDNTTNYNIYNRKVFLSRKGIEVCESIDRKSWSGKNVDYATFQQLKTETRIKTKSQVQLITLILILLSLFFSWIIVSPTGFFSFIGFFVVAVILFYVIGWLFNFLFDLFIR